MGDIKISQPTEYEIISNFISLRTELKGEKKTATRSTAKSIYEILGRPETNKKTLWSDDVQAMLTVFGIGLTKNIMTKRLANVLAGGGVLPFQRKHIELITDNMTKNGDLLAITYASSGKMKYKDVLAAAALGNAVQNIQGESAFGTSQGSNVNTDPFLGRPGKYGVSIERISKELSEKVRLDEKPIITQKDIERFEIYDSFLPEFENGHYYRCCGRCGRIYESI